MSAGDGFTRLRARIKSDNKLPAEHPKTNRGVWKEADFQFYNCKLQASGMEKEWANLGYMSARHFRPRRHAQPVKETTTSLQIFSSDDKSMHTAYHLKNSLLRLELHKCGLYKIPDALPTSLRKLQRIDLSCNSLTEESFPQAFNQLASLVELNLRNNLLKNLPTCILSLHRLQRLYLGFNTLVNFPVLDGLRHLTCLDLECNHITNIPWQELIHQCKKLSFLNLQSNEITSIDKCIKFYRELIHFNISHNKLKSIPVEVFLLNKLANLDVSHNEVVRLPQYNLDHMAHHMIDLLDLSFNRIYKFSDWLLQVAQTVDLTANQINSIQGSILGHMEHKTDQKVILAGNPLRSPPMAVCMAGLPSIIKYFRELKVHANQYQGLKVVVLGSKGCGKTSMIQSLADKQSRLTLSDEATHLCDISTIEMVAGAAANHSEHKEYKLMVWDVSGEPFYTNIIQQFLDPNALYILVFDLATYRTAEFEKNFAVWLNLIVMTTSNVKLLIVGTRSELLNASAVSIICTEVSNLVNIHLEGYKEAIRQKIADIEALGHIGAYMQDQLKHYVSALNNLHIYLHGTPIAISSAAYSGFDKLTSALNDLTSNLTLFPQGLRLIPSLWIGVHDTVEILAKRLSVPFMPTDEFMNEIVLRHGMKNMVEDIGAYLHDTGTILWLRSNKKLRDYVFLKPQWLIEVIRCLVKSNPLQINYEELEEAVVARSMTRSRFTSLWNEYSHHAFLDKDMTGILLSHVVPKNSNKTGLLLHILGSLLEFFYPIEKDRRGHYILAASTKPKSVQESRPKSAISIATESVSISVHTDTNEKSDNSSVHKQSSVDETEYETVPHLLIPSLRAGDKPDSVIQAFSSLQSQGFYRLSAQYEFKHYMPTGLLFRIISRLNQKQFHLVFVENWRTGLYARHSVNRNAYLIECWDEQSASGDVKSCLRFLAYKEQQIDFIAVNEFWADFLPILQDTEDLLSQFKGLRVDRYVECPSCFKPSFDGEWLAPKDLHAVLSVTCRECGESIRTELIIQPKEKKARHCEIVLAEIARRRMESKKYNNL